MAETAYCYHCAKHHPIEEMRQLETRTGKRWRCIKSIEATKKQVSERDAFGQSVTANNRSLNRNRAQAQATNKA